MKLTAPRVTAYIPHTPTEPQAAFLLLDHDEAFYGGAAGGGKSDALLMAALQYVDVPGYAGLLLRRSYADLSLPGAIMDRGNEWLRPTDAHWHETRYTWRFPSGATLTFGYLQHENDKYRYQGAEFQFVGFDELSQFSETQYRYLFSRLRRLEGVQLPIRMRAASNPGGVGHDWVKLRFIDAPNRIFIPARLEDNPHIDQAAYVLSLDHLDPVTRQRLLLGDWEAREPGGYFNRAWFDVLDQGPGDGAGIRRVRFWDMASTEATAAHPDPDWTVGVRLALERNGTLWVEHVVRARARPKEVEALVVSTARADGIAVAVRMEEEPGSSGKAVIEHYGVALQGFAFRGVRSSGDKETRAGPVSSRAEARAVKLVRGDWNLPFLDEVEAFPEGSHDDIVDALSGAYLEVLAKHEAEQVSYRPTSTPPVLRRGDLTLVGDRYIDR